MFGAVFGSEGGTDEGTDGGADEARVELLNEISENPGEGGMADFSWCALR